MIVLSQSSALFKTLWVKKLKKGKGSIISNEKKRKSNNSYLHQNCSSTLLKTWCRQSPITIWDSPNARSISLSLWHEGNNNGKPQTLVQNQS
jgi:hypothetical protein